MSTPTVWVHLETLFLVFTHVINMQPCFSTKAKETFGEGGGGLNGLRDIFIIYKDDWVGKK